MMAQHAQLVALISLVLFGLVGISFALIWRKLTFKVTPVALSLGVLIWISGLLLVFWQVRELRDYASMEAWPSVAGQVIRAQVVGVRAFRPNIVYRYQVGDQSFLDSTDLDQPGFGGRNNKRNAAETIIASYPPGREVVVHYDPRQPNDSLLRVSPDWSIFGKIGFGSFLFGLGLYLAARFFLQRR
jgi:hypothetical protein